MNFDLIDLHWVTIYKHVLVGNNSIFSAIYLSCTSFVLLSLQSNPWCPPWWWRVSGKRIIWLLSLMAQMNHTPCGYVNNTHITIFDKSVKQNWVTCWDDIHQAHGRFGFSLFLQNIVPWLLISWSWQGYSCIHGFFPTYGWIHREKGLLAESLVDALFLLFVPVDK